MAEFPLHPMYAKMLLTSEEFQCSEEAVTIAGEVHQNNTLTDNNRIFILRYINRQNDILINIFYCQLLLQID